MPQVYYKCDKCKRTHKTYDDAARCENTHLAASSIRAAEYRAGPYPVIVVLTFPDGKEQEYVWHE